MRSPGINGEGELRGQLANTGSPGKKAVKTKCVSMCYCREGLLSLSQQNSSKGGLEAG